MGALLLGCSQGTDVDSADSGVPEDTGVPWQRKAVGLERQVVDVDGLAVAIEWPSTSEGARFPDGAPVVVVVAGGSRPDVGFWPDADTPLYGRWGAVTVSFLFPGQRVAGHESGGTYDYRGPDTAAALATVLAFAGGQVAASTGAGAQTIEELVGYPVLQAGLDTRSLGGNLAPHALALGGGAAWYVGWETPVSPAFVTMELGRVAANPHYTARSCDLAGCLVDYSTLAWDDGRPFSAPDMATGEFVDLPGTVFFDTDGDGSAGVGEFIIGPLVGTGESELVAYFSPAVHRALDASGQLDPSLASVAAADAFWVSRAAVSGGANAWQGVAVPSMVLASEVDHVQVAVDHPHVVVQLQALSEAGAPFVRLNPDSSYLTLAGVEAADGPANRDWDYDIVLAGLVPESVELADTLFVAGVLEMIDRTHDDRWDVDLETVLWH
jgi:hypothetical protein